MEYIDLGLSVKWATCNVGASKPEDYGNYYAWGETIPKNIYLRETYLPNKNFNKVFKLPTMAEYKELLNKCTWTWTDDYNGTGVAGYMVVGPNGNSIFLPAGGGYFDSGVGYVPKRGGYWSSTPSYSTCAWDLTFNSRGIFMYSSYRYVGQSVRLVKNILKEK